MKIIKKNVYYCDFCNKRSLAGHATKKHEKHCTANPNRECRICEMRTTIEEEVEEFKARFTLVKNEDKYCQSDIVECMNQDECKVNWTKDPVTIEELQDRFDNCPACILSILRQTGMNKHYFGFKYDYQKEMQDAFDEKVKCQNEQREYYSY